MDTTFTAVFLAAAKWKSSLEVIVTPRVTEESYVLLELHILSINYRTLRLFLLFSFFYFFFLLLPTDGKIGAL